MKKIFMALLACLPLMGMAQNTWELPKEETPQQNPRGKRDNASEKKAKTGENPKYLAGTVPEVDGKVVFKLEKDVPDMTADDIYTKVYNAILAITKEENQFPQSKIAVVNKSQHIVAARLKEWMVFQNSFLALDRTIFNYTLIARADDGHLTLTMERLNYQYEQERTDTNSGMAITAEQWITDRQALTRKGNKLVKSSGKFRRKTIDRKDYIFGLVCKALNVKY